MTVSSLTNCQKNGEQVFFNFLLSDAKTFVLSGGAGVGKTFLMNHLSNVTMKRYEDSCQMLGIPQTFESLAFTATTNKAAEVLEQSIGQPVQTIHSFLGLKVYQDFKTGKTKITQGSNYKKVENIILFIDEASMIDETLYKILLESVVNSKIVFVGDHAQMAPVNEEISAVYHEVDEDNFIFLQEPVRNAGSPALVSLCEQLRATVETGEFHPIYPVEGSIEYLDPEQMQAKLHETFQNDMNPSARILCYTNNKVQLYNDYIREIRNLPRELSIGDIVVVASAYQLGKTTLSVERELKIRAKSGIEVFPVLSKPALEYRKVEVSLPGSAQTTEVRVAENPAHLKAAKAEAKKAKEWPLFFELQNGFADLRDKAACTVYKSQGSTYETVFIDLDNIGSSFDAAQVARMLFVGASRATTRVYLYGRLPNRYYGKEAA